MMRDLGTVKDEAVLELGQVKAEAEATISPLVSGILQDAQTLFRQEVALAKSEIKQDLEVAKEAAVGFSLTAATGAMAGLMLSLALAHLISWAAEWPIWAGYAIVAALYGIGAAVAYGMGRKALEKTDFVPHKTIQTMKENVQWIAGT